MVIRIAVIAALALTAFGCQGTRGPPRGAPDDVVTGMVLSESDVVGEPLTPVSRGRVFVVPAEQAAQLWARVDGDPLEERELGSAHFRLDVEDAQEIDGAVLQERGNAGRFTLPLGPGRYYICPDSGVGAIINIHGCGVVDIVPGDHVELFVGEGPTDASVWDG